jgi:hypothetical protein
MRATISAIFLAALIATAAAPTACVTGRDCTPDMPICTEVAFNVKQCTKCNTVTSRIAGGGSCYCDPSTSHCSILDGQVGKCAPSSIYNKPCSVDNDCVVHATTTLYTNWIEEVMYCVNQLCKPCSPALWATYNNGAVNGTITCMGYSSVLSNNYGHYTTAYPLPKFTFRCGANGDIVVVNSTLDFAYQYPYGDPSTWRPGTSTITGAAVPSTTTTGGSKSGGGQSNSNSPAVLLDFAEWLICALAIAFT